MARAFAWKPFGLALVAGSAIGLALAGLVRTTRLTEPFPVVAGKRYGFTLQLELSGGASPDVVRAIAATALASLGATNVSVSGVGPLYLSFEVVSPVTATIHPGDHLYPNTAGLEAATVLSARGPL